VVDDETTNKLIIPPVVDDEVITVKELSTRSLTGEGLRSTDYLTVPCCCCSERGHAMVERRYTKEQGIIHRARCPYLYNLRILETTTTREGDMLIFDIRAGVLARAHDYQFRLASNTWNQIRRNGIVSRVPQWKIDKFEAALEEKCLTGQVRLNRQGVTLPDDRGVIRVTEAVTDLVNGRGRRMTDFY